jgi:hypothetical protein
MFIEEIQSTEKVREYQYNGILELLDAGRRLTGVLLAVQYHVAGKLGVLPSLPNDHPIVLQIGPYLAEGRNILLSMLEKDRNQRAMVNSEARSEMCESHEQSTSERKRAK